MWKARFYENAHALWDYGIAFFLILAPYIFGFADVDEGRSVFIWCGVGMLFYSVLTDYVYSLARLLVFPIHRVFDIVTGAILISAPVIFAYKERINGFQEALHYGVGLLIILGAFVTRSSKRIGDFTAEEIKERERSRRAA